MNDEDDEDSEEEDWEAENAKKKGKGKGKKGKSRKQMIEEAGLIGSCTVEVWFREIIDLVSHLGPEFCANSVVLTSLVCSPGETTLP